MCSLHFDPSDHSAEQLVIQSLFADGFIRYAVQAMAEVTSVDGGFRVLCLGEAILADSAYSMGWIVADHSMKMTLSRDVPARIGSALRAFVGDLYARAGLDPLEVHSRTVFAVHPGGSKIIDAVRDRLELSESQVKTSGEALVDFRNMSSATLPHIWLRMLDDASIPVGSLVLSLPFGPGLSISGSIFRKH